MGVTTTSSQTGDSRSAPPPYRPCRELPSRAAGSFNRSSRSSGARTRDSAQPRHRPTKSRSLIFGTRAAARKAPGESRPCRPGIAASARPGTRIDDDKVVGGAGDRPSIRAVRPKTFHAQDSIPGYAFTRLQCGETIAADWEVAEPSTQGPDFTMPLLRRHGLTAHLGRDLRSLLLLALSV